MLLNNFYNLWAYISNHYNFSGQVTAFIDVSLKDQSGEAAEIPSQGSASLINPTYIVFKGLSAKLGDGEVEPDVDDYSLSGNELTFSNYTCTYDVGSDDGKNVVTMTISGYNTGSTAKTISEILVTKNIQNQSYYENPLAIARELLEEPIVVEPSTGFSRTIQIVFQ